MNQPTQSSPTPVQVVSREVVAVAAYYEWLKAGQPAGRDQEFWLKAESQLRKRAAHPTPQARLGLERLPAAQPGASTESDLGTPALPPSQRPRNGRKRPLKATSATFLA